MPCMHYEKCRDKLSTGFNAGFWYRLLAKPDVLNTIRGGDVLDWDNSF